MPVTEEFVNTFLTLLPKLQDEIKEGLERPISAKEITEAIEDLGKGKAPGPDGLGAAFYKTFKAEISEILHCVISEAHETKHLPPSFRKSHVVLIPKTTDTVKLKSVAGYRPISLTNSDYKST